MAFFERRYGLILLLGLGFVLLAAATWFIDVEPAQSATLSQRVLVQEAVNDLNACLTCHAESSTVVTVLHLADQPDDRSVPVAVDLQAQLDTHLVEAGQRILDLPESDATAYQTALSDYLQIYESTRDKTDHQSLLSALDRLGQLEQLLTLLEHQASPYRWKTTSTEPSTKVSAAVLSTVPPYAVLYHPPFLLDIKSTGGKNWNDMTIFAPVQIVFAAYRRGPPATEMFMESVWRTRLPSYDAQSRFSFSNKTFTCSYSV